MTRQWWENAPIADKQASRQMLEVFEPDALPDGGDWWANDPVAMPGEEAGQPAPSAPAREYGFFDNLKGMAGLQARDMYEGAKDYVGELANIPARGLTDAGLAYFQLANQLLPGRSDEQRDRFASLTADAAGRTRERLPVDTVAGQFATELMKPHNQLPIKAYQAGKGMLPSLKKAGYYVGAGAGLGAIGGALNPSEQPTAGGQADEMRQGGKIGAAVGAPVALAAGTGPDFYRYLMGNPNTEAANQWANRYVARKLLEEGATPVDDVLSRVSKGRELGTKEALFEAAESPTLTARAQEITRSPGPVAAQAQRFFRARAKDDIPQAIRTQAESLTTPEAGEMMDEVLSKVGKQQIDTSGIRQSIQGQMRGPEDTATNEALREVQGYLDWAESQGNTFEALHRAKQAIDEIPSKRSFENPKARETADRVVMGVRKQINDTLKGVSEDYGVANRMFQRNIAARRLVNEMMDVNRGSTGTLYNRMFGSEIKRQNLRDSLGDDAYEGLKGLMDSMERIKEQGFGGSDTAYKQAGQRDFQMERPGILPNSEANPIRPLQRLLKRWSDAVQGRDDEALMRVLTDPDLEELGRIMKQMDKKNAQNSRPNTNTKNAP